VVTIERKTPGVYVEELAAFPPSIVGVETAVPAFIGYTEKAEAGGKPLTNKPVRIESMASYEAYFGRYDIEQTFELEAVVTPPAAFDFRIYNPDLITAGSPSAGWNYYTLTATNPDRQFSLYDSMKLFYANGGGTCYVVSVGNYADATNGVEADHLITGLAVISEQVGPTILVVPDAVNLPSTGNAWESTHFRDVVEAMLIQAGRLQDRVAVLDVYGTQYAIPDGVPVVGDQVNLTTLISHFRTDVGQKNLSYGMAYFPFVHATVVDASDIDYRTISAATRLSLEEALAYQAESLYYQGDAGSGGGPYFDAVIDRIAQITSVNPVDPADKGAVSSLENDLEAMTPLLVDIEQVIARRFNLLPSSAAMAGVYTRTDQSLGVWNAPANTTLSSVTSPSFKLNDAQQGDLNRPVDGKAVDAIREFVGRGTVVWGARTLDGNSPDWRYVQLRRTLIYIEQSIKTALDQFVFAANDGQTWATVTAMCSTFLQGLWSRGGLMGATPGEAFVVECGLGSTMTQQDIREGYMLVQVTLNLIRPAEFIVLTFTQKMGE